jgi:hypothetical protein
MAPGRPSGSKNAPGHSAGGSRPGAGRKKATTDDLSEVLLTSASADTTSPAVGGSQWFLMLLHAKFHLGSHSAKHTIAGMGNQTQLYPMFCKVLNS